MMMFLLFPRASERMVLTMEVCCTSLYVHIFITSSHLHIFPLHIFTSSHLNIFSSSHIHIFSLSLFSSSHLHIFSSSHLHIFSSSHLHIFTSSLSLCLLPSFFTVSLLLFLFSLKAAGSADKAPRSGHFDLRNVLRATTACTF